MNGVNETLQKPAAQKGVVESGDLKDQYEELELQLLVHREKMKEAKTSHESNLKRASELRQALADIERTNTYSDYEKLTDHESSLMSRMQAIQAQLTSRQSRGKAIGAK